MDLEDHEGSVYHAMRLSENRFITSSQDQTIKIWDAEELRIITTLEVNDYITVMEVIPGKYLLAAIGHNSDYLFAWDARENFMGRECDLVLHEFCDSPITQICHLKHHGRGEEELVAVGNAKGEVAIWDLLELELDFECEIHDKGEIKSLIELQRGKYKGYLVTGGDDFSFKLIKLKEASHEYEIIASFGARGPVSTLCELKPGTVAVSDSNIVQIWDLNRPGTYIKEVIHHEDQIVKFVAIDNGEFVMSVGRDRKIIFWNTTDAETVFTKDSCHADIITDMILLNDKLITTCFDGDIKIFRLLFRR
jgi:WD40 repeat protein